MEPCEHVGFHTAQGRYDPETQRLRYVIICDACEAEVRELESQDYRPRFTPQGLPEAA
jgi:hypothetical protein